MISQPCLQTPTDTPLASASSRCSAREDSKQTQQTHSFFLSFFSLSFLSPARAHGGGGVSGVCLLHSPCAATKPSGTPPCLLRVCLPSAVSAINPPPATPPMPAKHLNVDYRPGRGDNGHLKPSHNDRLMRRELQRDQKRAAKSAQPKPKGFA